MKPPYPTLSEDIRFGHIIGVNPFQQILVKKKGNPMAKRNLK